MLKFLLPASMTVAMVAFATPIGNPRQNTYSNAQTQPNTKKAQSSSNAQHFAHSTIENPNSQRSWNGSGSNNTEQKPSNGSGSLKKKSENHSKGSQQK